MGRAAGGAVATASGAAGDRTRRHQWQPPAESSSGGTQLAAAAAAAAEGCGAGGRPPEGVGRWWWRRRRRSFGRWSVAVCERCAPSAPMLMMDHAFFPQPPRTQSIPRKPAAPRFSQRVVTHPWLHGHVVSPPAPRDHDGGRRSPTKRRLCDDGHDDTQAGRCGEPHIDPQQARRACFSSGLFRSFWWLISTTSSPRRRRAPSPRPDPADRTRQCTGRR